MMDQKKEADALIEQFLEQVKAIRDNEEIVRVLTRTHSQISRSTILYNKEKFFSAISEMRSKVEHFLSSNAASEMAPDVGDLRKVKSEPVPDVCDLRKVKSEPVPDVCDLRKVASESSSEIVMNPPSCETHSEETGREQVVKMSSEPGAIPYPKMRNSPRSPRGSYAASSVYASGDDTYQSLPSVYNSFEHQPFCEMSIGGNRPNSPRIGDRKCERDSVSTEPLIKKKSEELIQERTEEQAKL